MRQTDRRIRTTSLQPVLTRAAQHNARLRELAAAMRMPCAACGASLDAHIGPRNRWKGCHATVKGGAR